MVIKFKEKWYKTATDVANLAKSTFWATMSLEIRTPLNSVLGMVLLEWIDGVLDYSKTLISRLV